MDLFAAFIAADNALAARGIPPASPFWREAVRRFYEHPTARQLVACAGRGGDKSRTAVKMAIVETLAGEFKIPKGERHFFTFVSVNTDEASKTLGVLESYLRALGEGHTRRGDTIELRSLPRGFIVRAARIGAVSGWRALGWCADESAKWSNEGADPSAEIIASIRAMCVTHPKARGRMISSPLATAGHFYDAWSEGDTAHQVTCHAPSWVGNASITEEYTHALEPHVPTWRREYAAIPAAGASAAFDVEDVNAMVRELHPDAFELGQAVMVIDSSAGKSDAWAFALARFVNEGGKRLLYVDRIGAFEGAFAKSTSFEQVVAHCASVARSAGVRMVFGDQFQAFPLSSAFASHGMTYGERPWTSTTKIEATSALRRLQRDRALVLAPGEESDRTRQECLRFEEKILPSGALTVGAKRTRSGHADRASLLLMLAFLESNGDIFGAPTMTARLGEARFAPVRSKFTSGDLVSPQREQLPPRPAPFVGSRGRRHWSGRGGWSIT